MYRVVKGIRFRAEKLKLKAKLSYISNIQNAVINKFLLQFRYISTGIHTDKVSICKKKSVGNPHLQ